MSGFSMGDMFGGREGFGHGRGGDSGNGFSLDGIWQALDQMRGQFEQKVGSATGSTRVSKGDVRASVLALLAEQPMHGYQIIREIEERSGGSWKPSPGSVYPTLQLLTDEGLIIAAESDGRKTYSLTEEGRSVAGEDSEKAAPWKSSGSRDHGRMSALPKAGIDLAQAVSQVARSGNPEQVKQAIEVLDDARRKIFSILAQD